MADLGLSPSLVVDVPGNAYGEQQTPPYVRHDRMSNVASAPGAQCVGTRLIKSAGILCLEPQAYTYDMTTAMFTFPSGTTSWTTAPNQTTKVQHLYQSSAPANVEFDAVTASVLPANAAFYAVIERGEPGGSSGSQPTLDNQHSYTQIVVGANAAAPPQNSDGSYDYSGGVPVRLVCEMSRPPFLQMATYDGSEWVFSTKFGENGFVAPDPDVTTDHLLATNNRVLYVEWFPLPDLNLLVVSIRGLSDPLVLQMPSAVKYPLQVAAGNVQFSGMNGVASLGLFPMRFAPDGTFTSSQVDIPFVYQGNGFLRLYGAAQPAGTTLDSAILVDDGLGSGLSYQITMSSTADATGLAPTTPYVQQCGFYVPATTSLTTYTGGYADLSNRIAAVDEHLRFDPEKLLIRRTVDVALNNTDGYFAGATQGIHLAASYARNLTVRVGALMVPYSDPVQCVMGWMGQETATARADPSNLFHATIQDGLYPLERVQIGNAGFYDGWCCLRTIGFLAQISGRMDQFIDPLLLQCDIGPNPEDCPHLKLPLGSGDAPRVGFNPQVSFLDAMVEVAAYVHGVLFADEFNVLTCVPYNAVYTSENLGTFTTTGDGDGNPADSAFLSQMWRGLTLSLSTADRRTEVLLGSVDPATNDVVTTLLRIDDIPGMAGIAELVHGFRDPYVDIGNRYNDPDFNEQYAYNILERVWIPTLGTQHAAAFLPGMSPLLQYNITEYGKVINGTTTMVAEDIRNRWVATDPSAFGSSITGRALYNE